MYLTFFGSCSQLDNRTEGLNVAYSLVSVTDCPLLTFVFSLTNRLTLGQAANLAFLVFSGTRIYKDHTITTNSIPNHLWMLYYGD